MSKKSTNITCTTTKNYKNPLPILSFIVLSNISTISILIYLTKTNYIYNLYNNSPLPNFFQEDQIPLLTILILTLLHFIFPYITLQNRILNRDYDPNYPRVSQKQVKGLGLRLQSAYENFCETYPMYMTSLILAKYCQVNLNYQISLSIALMIGRYLHLVFYTINLPILRAFTFQYAQYSSFFLIVLSIYPNAFEVVDSLVKNYIK